MECGDSLPERAKFCPACGTEILTPPSPVPTSPETASTTAPATPEEPQVPPELKAKFEAAQRELRGDRREVVVLFADLEGFTSISEQLDPEEVSLIMQRVLGELADAVHRYEGYVDKYIGDAIMALFGAPLAHENDAERAALAALDMIESVARRNEDADHSLALRVGLNLGEVVAAHMGAKSRLQYTAMGDAVNVASRLEGAAEPDTILVSQAVYERIASRFETEEVPPVTVKGKSEPLRVHRIVTLRDSPGSTTSHRTPFVGRQEELGVVEEFLDSVSEGEGGTLVIEADAGAGKSRLISEAVHRSSTEFVRSEVEFAQIKIPGRPPPDASLFRDLMSRNRNVSGDVAMERALDALGDAADEHRSGVAGLIRRAFPDAPTDSKMGETGDARAARQNRWLALVALMGARSRERPLLVIVENVHWAGEEDEELLGFLVPALSRKPVGFLLTTRTGDRSGWLDDALTLRLEPLGEGAARSILGDILDALRPSVRREIIHRSQGNPLYLEELARSLMESMEAAAISVPGNVQGILKSRVDRLDPPVQLLLQMASVLGPRFSFGLLRRMYALEDQPMRFEVALDTLERKEIVTATEEGEEGDWQFRHTLMQEVVHGGILRRLRKVLHESAARLGEEFYADRLDAEAPFLAHHYWEADLPESAAPHLYRAGKDAAEQYDLYAAERWFGRLSQILDEYPDVLPRDSDRAEMMLHYGAVLLDRGDYDAADGQFQRLYEFGLEARRDDWMAQSLRYRGAIAGLRGDLEESRELYGEGLERVPSSETKIEADLLTGLGLVLYYAAEEEDALARLEAALERYQELDDLLGKAKCYINIGNVRDDLLHDPEGAERSYERALALIERVGDRRLETGVLLNLGTLAMKKGYWQTALARFREIETLVEETGWLFMRFLSLQNQASCELSLGEVGRALDHLETCLREGETMLKAPDRVKIRRLQFQAYFRALADDRAAAKLREARRVAKEIEIRETEDELFIDEGRMRAAEGEWEAARNAFSRALETAEQLGHPNDAMVARAHLHRAGTRAGEEEAEPPRPEEIPDQPTRALVRYLMADAKAIREPDEDTARTLEAVGETSSELGCVALKRAAFERAASVWSLVGNEEACERALRRATRAMEALASSLPPELREGFVEHPRNAALRERVPA